MFLKVTRRHLVGLLGIFSTRASAAPALVGAIGAYPVASLAYADPSQAPPVSNTRAFLSEKQYPETAAEARSGAKILSFDFAPGDLRRYGADPTGVEDSSVAWQTAVSLGYALLPVQSAFKILRTANISGQVTVTGCGKTSKLLSDTTVLKVFNGSDSCLDNFCMENITAPWIIERNLLGRQRDVVSGVRQSNDVMGYQPSSNDFDIFPSLTKIQQSQDIGPVISFEGRANNIEVSRVHGRFVRINIADATDSSIHDCDIRGGKGRWGALVFDNATNGLQRGSNNSCINNRVRFASFSGCAMIANDDFVLRGNVCHSNGESGVKTMQAGGIAFSKSVGGSVSGTLTAAWRGPTSTEWNIGFANGEVRSNVTLRSGSSFVEWSLPMAEEAILNASVWGVGGSPSSNVDPRCFRGHIADNKCYQNFYDGLDLLSTYGTTNDSAQTFHLVENNQSSNNGGTGINADGQFNSYIGNHISKNRSFGIWGTTSLSQFSANYLIDNNQARVSTNSELSVSGALANNKIDNNFIWGGRGQNNVGIWVGERVLNYVTDNVGVGSCNFSLGIPSGMSAVSEGNIDSVTGPVTSQSFCFQVAKRNGVIQHKLNCNNKDESVGRYDRILQAISQSYTNTPTGQDLSTAMIGGAKVSSSKTNVIIFDTSAQKVASMLMNASVVFNSAGVTLTVCPQCILSNINGVIRTRLAFAFFNATTGAEFAIVDLPDGAGVAIQFYGKLA